MPTTAHRLLAIPALVARGLIQLYRHTLSSLVGRTCRHLPTCSEYADEAIARHGLWRGGWVAAARIWRCRPFGSSGFDPVPASLPAHARWFLPWRYGSWARVIQSAGVVVDKSCCAIDSETKHSAGDRIATFKAGH